MTLVAPMSNLTLLGELVSRRQWVAWRYEDTGRAKPSKTPYNPRTLTKASVNKPSTWGTHAEAVAAANGDGFGFEGVGFVFTEDRNAATMSSTPRFAIPYSSRHLSRSRNRNGSGQAHCLHGSEG